MGFSRQEYCSGLPCPPPGDLPNPEIEPIATVVPALQADSLPLGHWGSPSPHHPSPSPTPRPLASTRTLSDSMNLTILGTSYKWNQTVFVCTYCILECIFSVNLIYIPDFPGSTVVKNLPASAGRCKRHGFDPGVGKISWRRKWQHTLVFLPGKFSGQRSLVGYSPWGHRELDTSEHTRIQYMPYEQTAPSWSFSLHAIQLTYIPYHV